jgi:hypothetical protein
VKDNHLKVDAFGSLKVAPQYGNVTARAADPNDTFHGRVGSIFTITPILTTGARPAVITSIHVSVRPTSGAPQVNTTIVGPDNDCAAPVLEQADTIGAETVVFSYDPGILVPPSSFVCADTDVDFVSNIAVFGYFLDA